MRKGGIHCRKNTKYRPKSIEDRKEFGHFELYTMVSTRNTSGVCFTAFVEEKQDYIQQLKCQIEVLNLCDRGKDFACYAEIQNELEPDKYFAEPHSPW